MDISGRRWNQILSAVNYDRPASDINPPLNEEELEIYNSTVEERKRIEAETGQRLWFELAEIDFDDPMLDIYND